MYKLQSINYSIEIGSLGESTFELLLNNEFKDSKKIIIVDENTKEYCLEYLITSFDQLSNADIIELPSGEENKQIEICLQVWESFSEYKFDKNSIVINLGGGVITDMGGFIASLYKRGIKFINIPTSLLAMVDASIGGKTGVDLGIIKNQIGLISFPYAVYIDPCFISTLDSTQIFNGLAEMLKHGLISDRKHWECVIENMKSKEIISSDLIYNSLLIKNNIVCEDPLENGKRKLLNFGHTVGHALESYFLQTNNPIFHGYAVIAGIIIESYISYKLNYLKEIELIDIKGNLSKYYSKLNFPEQHIDLIIEMMKQDKKNDNGKIKMVLLKSIGDSLFNIEVNEKLIEEGLKNYLLD